MSRKSVGDESRPRVEKVLLMSISPTARAASSCRRVAAVASPDDTEVAPPEIAVRRARFEMIRNRFETAARRTRVYDYDAFIHNVQYTRARARAFRPD